MTVNQTPGNSITRTLYWNSIYFHCAVDTQATASDQDKHLCTHSCLRLCTETHTILTQVGGTNGHKLSKPTHRDTHAPTTLAHALLLFYLLSINQISAYFGNAAPSRGRSVLGAHCREPHCQPTAPTLMTSSLCTIHQSRTCPTVIPFSCSY